jgi:hypothetical protein
MQYRWVMYFGFPVISDGGESGRGLGYYHCMPGTSWNVPEFCFAISLLANLILLPAAWQFTKGARGRYRMRLLVGICSVLSLGFSFAVVRWEKTHLWHVEWARDYYSERGGEFGLFKVKKLDEALEQYREARSR